MAGFSEQYWLEERGWKHLRSDVTKVAAMLLICMRERHVEDEYTAELFSKQLLEDLINELERKRKQEQQSHQRGSLSYSMTKWDHALSLFGDRSSYIKALQHEFEKFVLPSVEEGKAIQHLRKAINQRLEDARRRLALASPHRVAVWEKIKKISQEVHRRHGRLGHTDENSDEHLSEILQVLLQRYPNSRNTVKSLDLLKNYFTIFQPGYLHQLADHDAPDESFSQAFREEFNETLRLGPCLEQLRKAEPDSWETLIVKFDYGDLPFDSITAYQAHKSIKRYQFEKLLAKGLQLMAECMKKTANFRYQGAP